MFRTPLDIQMENLKVANHSKRHGIVLNEKLALEIYKCKHVYADSNIKGKSVPVSKRFGVSPKTVRDIWTRRTWANATCAVWSENEVEIIKSYSIIILFGT